MWRAAALKSLLRLLCDAQSISYAVTVAFKTADGINVGQFACLPDGSIAHPQGTLLAL